ncbi:hypothetical protein F4212_11895 [Candidatus Poribacteria bacterium]|nr:hypothetical protein [Candidatus Poribacteria bacterium]
MLCQKTVDKHNGDKLYTPTGRKWLCVLLNGLSLMLQVDSDVLLLKCGPDLGDTDTITINVGYTDDANKLFGNSISMEKEIYKQFARVTVGIG